jgi:ribosome-associated heat shock protein Hsp15
MRGNRHQDDDGDRQTSDVRLDKWLWAARFFRTRSLASEGIVGGKVHVNGERAKRAHPVRIGDEIRIRNGAFEHILRVRALSAKRGRSTDAGQLYEETAASRAAREALAAQLRSLPATHGRPTKRDRREIERWRGR